MLTTRAATFDQNRSILKQLFIISSIDQNQKFTG